MSAILTRDELAQALVELIHHKPVEGNGVV
jgi:hypothetical protein